MPTCNCPGESLVGSMTGFNGWGQGQREKTAIQNAYASAGLTDAYLVLAKNAMRWECEGDCRIATRFEITPAPVTRHDPASALWFADLADATLKVWVVCSKPAR